MIFKPHNATTRRAVALTASCVALSASIAALASPAAIAAGRPSPAPAPASAPAPVSLGSLTNVADVTGATDMWACGWTGRGVDVALIDTGVAPVSGGGALVNGPDLSIEGQVGAPRSIDGDGHGTHLASIINGRDRGVSTDTSKCRAGAKRSAVAPATNGFSGIAPGARVVNVKVGDADGAVDVSQVIAAIDWVVQHRNTDGFNIRVLALAYTVDDSAQDWTTDPLSYAADVARRNGIVVVAAAGNDGSDAKELAFPAQNPNLIAVGALDFHGSTDRKDWDVADFASRGSGVRSPDLVAPGVSIEGLAVPGSMAAVNNPASIVDGRFIKGSGTSQATAVVAGISALLLQRYPDATPAQVKQMLVMSSKKLRSSAYYQGAGVPTPEQLLAARPGNVKDPAAKATGTGRIEPLRSGGSMTLNNVPLTGEIDIQGKAFSTGVWAPAAAAGTTWAGGAWRGTTWSDSAAASWAIAPWASNWANVRWSDLAFDGPVWDGIRWSGAAWGGIRWSGVRWSGADWSGIRWSGIRWSGIRWSGIRWSGASWT